MPRVTRSSVLLKIQDLLGLQSGAQAPPVECKPDIQPVLEAGPRYTLVVKSLVSTTTSSGALVYTTPSDKDFYLTFITMSVTKDVLNDNVLTRLLCYIGGLQTSIIQFDFQTLTAFSAYQTISFPYPIKIDRNSRIDLAGTFAAGSMSKKVTIGGFILE